MAERYYANPRQLQIGNALIKIEVKQLNHGIKPQLRNFFQNYSLERDTGMFEGIEIPAGAIESLVIRRALVNLYHNDTPTAWKSPDPVEDFPEVGMGNEDGDVDLYEEVLKTCVDANRFLARLYPFNMVFGQYLALVKDDKRKHEEEMQKKTGAAPDVVEKDDVVGPNPTPSQEDTSTVKRISGGSITGTGA